MPASLKSARTAKASACVRLNHEFSVRSFSKRWPIRDALSCSKLQNCFLPAWLLVSLLVDLRCTLSYPPHQELETAGLIEVR